MLIKVTNGIPEEYSIRQLRLDNPSVSFKRDITPAELADYDVYEVEIVKPVYDPNIETLETPIISQVSGVWKQMTPVRNLTPQELAEKQANDGRRYIRNGVELIGKLQVQLINNLIANGVIDPAAFSPNARKDYQKLKAAVDRIAD